MPGNNCSEQIQTSITSCFIEAKNYAEEKNNTEAKINMALSKAKDVGMRLAKESLDPNNNFVNTIMSGSKGDFFNIAQIMGLLGQQNVGGGRIQPHLNNRTRTLPHYSRRHLSFEAECESRGFIQNSFLRGLSPREFWFHAMSGREGLTDTATKTAQSGYTQRKMVKIMEDVQIQYDQTVRNSMGSIIQFAYGHDNLCPTKMVLVDGKPRICNINRLAEQINLQMET
jgi:DNA-directed RNA polymerase II subunit RPB1